MTRIAFADKEGDCLPVAWWCVQEGHDVTYWIRESDRRAQKIGVGLVDRAYSLDDLLASRPDVLVSYQTPSAYARAVTAGIPAIGSSRESVALEEDRLAAARLATRFGLTVPEMKRFGSVTHAKRFVDDSDTGRWVVKAEGGSHVATSTTHVADSKAELFQTLDYEAGRGMDGFVLQRRVDGVEVSTEGWYDYRVGWVAPFNSTLERKRMHTGDVGPMCGCAGSIVWYWPEDEPRLAREVLLPWTRHLESIRYVGPFDVNAIIDYQTQTPNFLEVTPRLGWSAFNAVMAGASMNVGDWLAGFAAGEGAPMTFRHPFMASVRVSIAQAEDVPIIAPYHAVRHIQPSYLWLDGKTLRTSGAGAESSFAPICEATDAGSSIDEVVADIYQNQIPRVHAPDLTFRKDIGQKAYSDLATLESWGYVVRPPETLTVADAPMTRPEPVRAVHA